MAGNGLYDRLVPAALVALVLAGAYYGRTPLVALATTLLLTLLLTRYWSRHSLDDVHYEREASDDRAFPGDEVLLSLRLANDKLLPLPWVEVDDRVPWQLNPTPAEGDSPALLKKDRLKLAGSVLWKERVVWRYRLRCERRGIFRLGPAEVTSGDPFGFFPCKWDLGETSRLVVYPKLLPLEELALPPGFPLGETRPERWIFEDPSRTLGVRDYRREDPFRRIHWKATARRQELQVKVLEPSTTLETALFLGVDTFGESLAFEHAVSVSASLAYLLIGQRHPVGLYLNGGLEGSTGAMELPPGSSQEQLIRILEMLAGVEPVASTPVATLVAATAPRLPWGSSVIVVAGSLPENLRAALQALRRTGRQPVFLFTGKGAVPEGDEGITVLPA